MSTFMNNWLLRRAMSAPRGGKYIHFADPVVRQICIANFSTDGIGVTYEDAAAVTSVQLGTTFRLSQIATFDEFQYFTGLTTIPYAAFSGSSVSSIILNETLTGIGGNSFRQTRLVSITIPSSVTFIDNIAFYSSQRLNTVVVEASNPPVLGSQNNSFAECGSSLKIYVPYSADHSILSAYQSSWNAYADKLHELNPDGTIPS